MLVPEKYVGDYFIYPRSADGTFIKDGIHVLLENLSCHKLCRICKLDVLGLNILQFSARLEINPVNDQAHAKVEGR